MKKNCSLCVYNDGLRADGTYKCCTPERQRDATVIDCCILESPLRVLQREASNASQYILTTQKYIQDSKMRSNYWNKQIKASE
jgi:hypothetical protein